MRTESISINKHSSINVCVIMMSSIPILESGFGNLIVYSPAMRKFLFHESSRTSELPFK